MIYRHNKISSLKQTITTYLTMQLSFSKLIGDVKASVNDFIQQNSTRIGTMPTPTQNMLTCIVTILCKNKMPHCHVSDSATSSTCSSHENKQTT